MSQSFDEIRKITKQKKDEQTIKEQERLKAEQKNKAALERFSQQSYTYYASTLYRILDEFGEACYGYRKEIKSWFLGIKSERKVKNYKVESLKVFDFFARARVNKYFVGIKGDDNGRIISFSVGKVVYKDIALEYNKVSMGWVYETKSILPSTATQEDIEEALLKLYKLENKT